MASRARRFLFFLKGISITLGLLILVLIVGILHALYNAQTIIWESVYIVLGFLGPLALFFLLYSIRLYRSVQVKNLLQSAHEFIQHVQTSDREYCLILRPFGADGFIPIRTFERFPWRLNTSETLEEVIEDSVQDILHCETVALVDPKLTVLPPSPMFISTDNASWQTVIESLLRRAIITVLIIPPDKDLTGAVLWEMKRIVALGLVGRFLIVLPPPSTPGYDCACESAQKLCNIFPAMSQMTGDPLLIFPNTHHSLEWWKPEKPKSKRIIGKTAYKKALTKILTDIHNELQHTSPSQKYAYKRGPKELTLPSDSSKVISIEQVYSRKNRPLP